MQKYPVRTSHRANLSGEALEPILRNHFESVRREGDAVSGQFGAISRIVAQAAGKDLSIVVEMNPQVAADLQAETIRRYNRFLEEVTGFSSKERAKRLRKSATSGGPSE